MAYFDNPEELNGLLQFNDHYQAVGWKDLRGNKVSPRPGDRVYIFPIPSAPEKTLHQQLEDRVETMSVQLNGGFRLQLDTLYKTTDGKLRAALTWEQTFDGYGPRAIEEQASTVPHSQISLDIEIGPDGFMMPKDMPILNRQQVEGLTNAQDVATQICLNFLSKNSGPTWKLFQDLLKLSPNERTLSLEGMYSCPKNKPRSIHTSVIGFDGPNKLEMLEKLLRKHGESSFRVSSAFKSSLWRKELEAWKVLPPRAEQEFPAIKGQILLNEKHVRHVTKQLRGHLAPDKVDIINAHHQPGHGFTKELTLFAALGRLLDQFAPQQKDVLYHRLNLEPNESNPIESVYLFDLLCYRLGLWDLVQQKSVRAENKTMQKTLEQALIPQEGTTRLNPHGKQLINSIRNQLSKIIYGNPHTLVKARINALREGE